MSVYEEIKKAADRMDDYALAIELDSDLSVITKLKRERVHLLQIADEYKKMELHLETQKSKSSYLERLLFFELLRQKDAKFMTMIKPIVGEEDFEWRSKHQLFTNQEISTVIGKLIELDSVI